MIPWKAQQDAPIIMDSIIKTEAPVYFEQVGSLNILCNMIQILISWRHSVNFERKSADNIWEAGDFIIANLNPEITLMVSLK